MDKETVTISKEEYEKLKDRDLFLSALEYNGVDNWMYYEYALDDFNDMKSKESSDK